MGKWIYYVEDDTSIRELVLYALKTAEFQVMGFENAASFYKNERTAAGSDSAGYYASG